MNSQTCCPLEPSSTEPCTQDTNNATNKQLEFKQTATTRILGYSMQTQVKILALLLALCKDCSDGKREFIALPGSVIAPSVWGIVTLFHTAHPSAPLTRSHVLIQGHHTMWLSWWATYGSCQLLKTLFWILKIEMLHTACDILHYCFVSLRFVFTKRSHCSTDCPYRPFHFTSFWQNRGETMVLKPNDCVVYD